MTQTLAPAASAPVRKPRRTLSWRYRGEVAVRAFAAVVIGYAVAYASTAFLTLVLPLGRNDRVVTASLLCFFVWCGVAVYAFAARTPWRACWAPALWAIALYGIAASFPELGARP